jgi:Xaa-Pro aminopeptidase
MDKNPKQKLEALRLQLTALGLDGFIVPRMSEYQGEFVAAYAERLKWLTGFTGSAGTALVLQDRAAILTDGRYTLQLAQQADSTLYEFENITHVTVPQWLSDNTKPGAAIGYDPWLLTVKQVQQIERVMAGTGIELIPVQENPIDALWEGRPSFPMANVEIFPDDFAGVAAGEKIKSVCEALRKENLSACLITLPDSLAWLLNVRGGDVEHTPVVLSFGILHENGHIEWLVHREKLNADIRKHLGAHVEIVSPDKIFERIAALNGKVGLDFSRSPAWFKQTLGDRAVNFKDPCIEPKSIKSKEEQEALRAAHIRDGAALVNFLYWLDMNESRLTELDIVEKLEEFRRGNKAYRGPSFSTISGWNANGAIVHYRATEETNAPVNPPGLLLLDSGGQYNDGTTDITRTVAIGPPTDEMQTAFTLVLKGHIAVASAKFPEGTTGAQIDALARAPLWAANLDYAHGTGHGVGCFLSVHEESAGISPRGSDPLRAGMFLSNEPGYYKEGAFGIRTENLILVRKDGKSSNGQEMLYFETLSLAPVDRRLIKKEMLSATELQWLNDYHSRVIALLSPYLDMSVRDWLAQQAAAL